MTYRVDIADAPHQLLALIKAAEQGEEVILTKNAAPIIQLVPITAERPRPTFGSAKGQIIMHADFDEPLDDFAPYMP